MSRYEHDPRVRYERGGYTVNSNGSRVRVLPYEGGHRWSVFTGPPGSTVLSAPRNAPEYRSAPTRRSAPCSATPTRLVDVRPPLPRPG